MLTTQNWIDAGYRKFNHVYNGDYGLQKLIKDEIGKRYFITVYVYEWFKYPNFAGTRKVSFAPTVQFCFDIKPTVNIDLIINENTLIEEVEDVFNGYWEFNGKPYYEYYEGD
jgi:hypothetical protein